MNHSVTSVRLPQKKSSVAEVSSVAHLDRVPANGATLVALPMPIAGGSGGPTRAIAILP